MRFHTLRETHNELRGGKGIVTTHTTVLKTWFVFGHYSPKKRAIKLELMGYASIGVHYHENDSEIYLTFDRNVRFNGKKKFHFINVCLKGHCHCAENIGEKKAKIYALKF